MKKIFNLAAFALLFTILPSMTSCSNDYEGDITGGLYEPLAFVIYVVDNKGKDLLNTKNSGHVDIEKLRIKAKGLDLKVGDYIKPANDSIPRTIVKIYKSSTGQRHKLIIGDYSFTQDYIDEKATITWEDGHTDSLSFTKKGLEPGYYYYNGKLQKGNREFTIVR